MGMTSVFPYIELFGRILALTARVSEADRRASAEFGLSRAVGWEQRGQGYATEAGRGVYRLCHSVRLCGRSVVAFVTCQSLEESTEIVPVASQSISLTSRQGGVGEEG